MVFSVSAAARSPLHESRRRSTIPPVARYGGPNNLIHLRLGGQHYLIKTNCLLCQLQRGLGVWRNAKSNLCLHLCLGTLLEDRRGRIWVAAVYIRSNSCVTEPIPPPPRSSATCVSVANSASRIENAPCVSASASVSVVIKRDQ